MTFTTVDDLMKMRTDAGDMLADVIALRHSEVFDTTTRLRLAKAEAYFETMIDLMDSAKYQLSVGLWNKREMTGEQQELLLTNSHGVDIEVTDVQA